MGFDVAPVIFLLRMHHWIAIDLGRRRLQDPRTHALGKTEHVDSTHDRRLDGLHGVVLIVNRRRRTSKVVDLVHLEEYRLSHVMTQQLEARIVE